MMRREWNLSLRGGFEIAVRVWPEGFDVIHAHDWHAACDDLRQDDHGRTPARVCSVVTVHNLMATKAVCGFEAVDRLDPRAFRRHVPAQDGHVNLLKGAVALADAVTTVSPTYAREIQTHMDMIFS